jgi:exopolysaccharide production protein ExoQ
MSFLRHIGYRSHALWVPFVFLLFSGTRNLRLLVPVGDPAAAQDFTEGAPLERSFLLLLMAAAALIVARRRVAWMNLLGRNAALLLLFALMAASILWSGLPWVSLKRFVKAVGLLGVLAVLLTDRDPYQALKFLLRRFCWFVLPLSLVFIFLIPELGVGHAYDGSIARVGACFSKNNLGQAAAIGVLIAVFGVCDREKREGWFWNVALLALSAVTLLVSHSATSLLVALYGMGVLALVTLSAYASIGYTGTLIALILVVAAASVKLVEELVLRQPMLPLLIEALGRDATLTGRTDLWRDVLLLANRHPVIGHGFGSFWVGDIGAGGALWRDYVWLPNQAHCGYLDVYAELGWLGLACLGAALAVGLFQALAMLRTHYDYARARLVLIAAVCAINVTESSFCRAIHLLWFLALAALASPADARAAAHAARGGIAPMPPGAKEVVG